MMGSSSMLNILIKKQKSAALLLIYMSYRQPQTQFSLLSLHSHSNILSLGLHIFFECKKTSVDDQITNISPSWS
jgi:hypothetical protein